MKIISFSKDWGDEFEMPILSIIGDAYLEAIQRIIEIFNKHGYIDDEDEWTFGTNEYFYFSGEELLDIIEDAKDISDREYLVLDKFNIGGYDMLEHFTECKLREWFDKQHEFNQGEYYILKGNLLQLYDEDAADDLLKNVIIYG
jgi:hypothetical protein